MTNSETKGRSAPYVSASTLSSFFDHVRWVSTPKKVDTGLLQDYGMPKGNIGALVSALKFFGLVEDDGTPTPAFKMIQTGGDEFRANLDEIVRRAYGDVFSRLDPSRDSREKLRNYFARNYSPAVSRKATILFLDLCKEAGISVAEGIVVTTKATAKTPPPSAKKELAKRPEQQPLLLETERKTPVATLTDDDLRRMYVRRLIENMPVSDTTGKDAQAIEAEARLIDAQLARIERLLGISFDDTEKVQRTDDKRKDE